MVYMSLAVNLICHMYPCFTENINANFTFAVNAILDLSKLLHLI